MKRSLAACLLASVMAVCAAPSAWMIDFEAAKKKAAEEKKNLLVNFTGSDWCGYCIQLDKEVFRKEAFLDGVKDKFVLVTIDFPEDETKVDEKTRAQNEKLQETYRIEGYPTILLADSAGRPFAFTGFEEGGAAKYLAHLDGLMAGKAAYDKAVAEAAGLEGMEKASRIGSGLDALEIPFVFLSSFYQDDIRLVESIDKDGTLPISRKLAIEKRFHELEAKVEGLIEEGKVEEALSMVDAGMAEPGYDADKRQRMSFFKVVVYMENGKYDESLKEIEKCRQLLPDSEVAQGLDVLINHIEALRQEQAEAAPDAGKEEGKADEKTE